MTNPSIFQVELDGRALPVTLRVPGTPFAVHFAVDWSVSIQRDGVKDERLTALLLRRHGLKKVTRDLLCQIGSELGAIAGREALRKAGVPIEITSREQAIELYGPLGADAWDVHVGRLVEMPFRVFKLSKPAKPYPAPEVDPVVRTSCPTLGESCVGRVVWLSDNTARFECDGAECEVGKVQREARARGRCATCKHWERHETRKPDGVRKLVPLELGKTCGSCRTPSPLIGTEGEDVYTAPDFGCVLFERREDDAK